MERGREGKRGREKEKLYWRPKYITNKGLSLSFSVSLTLDWLLSSSVYIGAFEC